MVVNLDEGDINPPRGPKFKPQEWKTHSDLLQQFEVSLKAARSCRKQPTIICEHKVAHVGGGQVVEGTVILNHMADHRGQLTVYLRLNDEKVPAIYGPSADEGKG